MRDLELVHVTLIADDCGIQTLMMHSGVDIIMFLLTHTRENGQRTAEALIVDLLTGIEIISSDPKQILFYMSPPISVALAGELHICAGEDLQDVLHRRIQSMR